MRNANVKYEPQMFLCTNPSYHSFLRHWIQDFYLDHEGVPRSDRSNVERYFVLVNNSPLWFDTREEAEAIYGTGKGSGIRSFRSIKAVLSDNVPLMKANPSYISNLMALPRVEQLIMLHGSWLARLETSGFWNRTSVKVIPQAPVTGVKRRVLAVDFAFTEPSEVSKNPDSTAFVLMSKSDTSMYTVEYVETMQKRVHDVEQRLFQLAECFGQETWISLPVDPNAQAGAYARDLQRRLAEKGFMVRLQKPVKSKTVRFQPFASVSQSGFVQVVDADWNQKYFDELELFDGTRKVHDDMVDATSDAFFLLNQGYDIPDMDTTALSQSFSIQNQSSIPSSQGLPTGALGLPINF
jgi:predicted phage terminase large subunit-like protein